METEEVEEWGGAEKSGNRVEYEEQGETGLWEEGTSQEEEASVCEELFPCQGDFRENEKKTRETEEASAGDSAKHPEAPLVLEPDHPMMEKFQAALKAHLLKQLERLTSQVAEMDHEIRKKEKEKEETGLQMYAMQQEMYRQQKTLEDCEAAIENLTKERQALDESVSLKKTSWKEELDRLNCAKKKESDKMSELHKLSSLEKQMEKWEKEMESELTVSQRISEKSQHDKQKMIEEKRKMDMYLLRLMTAVSNHEAEIKLLDAEIDVKSEEKDLLNQTLADAAADLQCLVTEQKRLLAAWNAVVSTINHRNLIYTDVNKDLTIHRLLTMASDSLEGVDHRMAEKCQEGFLSLNAEIESYKRSSAEEMKKSEKLAIVFGRLQNDFENCELTMKNLMHRKQVLEDKITSVASLISRTDADCQNYKMQTEKHEVALNKIKTNLELFCGEKRAAEDEAMNFIHEQMIKDNSASNLSKLLRAEREKVRKQEFIIIETENKISQKFLEVEELKEIVARNNEITKETNNELNRKEEELKTYQDEIVKCQSTIIQRQGCYATLLRKIERCTEMQHAVKSMQEQIMDLEKSNAEIQAKNDKLQSFWLLQQNSNVKLTHQRHKQLKDINLLRRQVLLLEQRALKIDLEFEKERKIENSINKSILQLQHKLSILSDVLVGKKGYRENLGKENTLTQAQYLQNLKDAELEQIRLKAEIKDLEANLEELAEAMLSAQREMLAWEKKIQSAVEAKTEMQKERSDSGEVGQMKIEIHRMEVRYGQLKKVQEKLITDLEHCVLRRDAIFDGAEAMEKRLARGLNTRSTIEKKIESLKNDIRGVCNVQKHLEKLIADSEEGHRQLKKAILKKEAQLLEMKETTKKMDEHLQEGKLHKCQNLETLIRRQKKCKLYELIRSGKHKPLFKNEGVLEKELQKVKHANNDLISVLEALIENFPAYQFQLKKIYNTLRADPA